MSKEDATTSASRSRRIVIGVVILLIVIIAGVVFLFYGSQLGQKFQGSSGERDLGGVKPGGTVTMKDLQLDYNAWKGNFKSYDENDTVMLRDKITSIEFGHNPFGNPITVLYFGAYPLPTMDDLRSGRVQNGSWYLWLTNQDPLGSSSGCYSIFPIKQGEAFDSYLPEVGIDVVGDVRDRFHVGDTVEIALHVRKLLIYDPDGTGFWWVEAFHEFKFAVSPEKVEKL